MQVLMTSHLKSKKSNTHFIVKLLYQYSVDFKSDHNTKIAKHS